MLKKKYPPSVGVSNLHKFDHIFQSKQIYMNCVHFSQSNQYERISKPPGIGTSLSIAVRSRATLILKYLISISSQKREV